MCNYFSSDATNATTVHEHHRPTDERPDGQLTIAIVASRGKKVASKQTGVFVDGFKLLIKPLDSQMLDVRTVVVADRLAGSPVELLFLQWRRQRSRRHVDDRRILTLSHYSLRIIIHTKMQSRESV